MIALVVIVAFAAVLFVRRALPEWQFRRGVVTPRHVADVSYRARMEMMPSAEVERLLSGQQDAVVADYLARLLDFCREQEALKDAPAGERMSATFILGDDANDDNRFYAAAADFYRYDTAARTELVEASLRSLAQVRDFLARRPANRLPWGVVNLVTHSYEWGGLAVPVLPGYGRTDAVSLRLAIQSGDLKPLPDSVVDCRTDIRIQGCALGRDSTLLALLGVALGGRDVQRPQVRSSRCFVFYESERRHGGPATAGQFFADYWYVVYPKGRRPGNPELAQRLAERYPGVAMDWRAALGRKEAREPGEPYARWYGLPVNWLTVYPDSLSRPSLSGARQRRAWLESQDGLGQYLDRIRLSLDDFLWSVRDTVVPDSGGARPAILATGRGTIVSILRTMVEPDSTVPSGLRHVTADPADPRYFAAVVPARPASEPPGMNVLPR